MEIKNLSYLPSLWIWRSCMKQSSRMKIFLSWKQVMMTSQEGFTKYCFLIGGYEYKMNINEIMSSLYAEIITLCFSSPEVFTQIFLQFWPKKARQVLPLSFPMAVWLLTKSTNHRKSVRNSKLTLIADCSFPDATGKRSVNISEYWVWDRNASVVSIEFHRWASVPPGAACSHRQHCPSLHPTDENLTLSQWRQLSTSLIIYQHSPRILYDFILNVAHMLIFFLYLQSPKYWRKRFSKKLIFLQLKHHKQVLLKDGSNEF